MVENDQTPNFKKDKSGETDYMHTYAGGDINNAMSDTELSTRLP
jgi:hypothetical protein